MRQEKHSPFHSRNNYDRAGNNPMLHKEGRKGWGWVEEQREKMRLQRGTPTKCGKPACSTEKLYPDSQAS